MVRNSIGPWNRWPDGQQIFTFSMGPPVEPVLDGGRGQFGPGAHA